MAPSHQTRQRISKKTAMTQHLGKFEIRRELGRGAQSVVYLAFDKLNTWRRKEKR